MSGATGAAARTLRPAGPLGLLIEVAEQESPVRLAEILRRALAGPVGSAPLAPAEPAVPGSAGTAPLLDVVPGATTVLVECASESDLAEVRALVAATPVQPDEPHRVPTDSSPDGDPNRSVGQEADDVVLDVVYDGPDLSDVAARLGVTPDEVADLHCSARYTVAFCGFAPGFAYLRGTPEALCLPRLATPRTDVPAGSVAVAGGWSAVYPRSGPGGWILLGRTERTLFDVDAEPPALLAPGRHVVFRRIG